MKTNDLVIGKVIKWLESEEKSFVWLAEQLGVSLFHVEYMLKGERILKSERIEQIAKIMGIKTKELVKSEVIMENQLTVKLLGSISNRRSKRELDSLLFAINDYLGLKEQTK
ncbi:MULTISPECIES: XRE family transcriptional regulator [Bacilli]|uniref:XRE family transcriptional regulator n=1 Tax=Lysinibacillus capsici TaxID=2115968 RepID=A0ABY8KBE6_9BACI|nr:XRE family transcriptional regulator [Lysinibacillus capsici]MDP1395147.1 XRE family transcriptional regulator [Lysinibacillus capsici]MDP1415354.1 XRE family transcriptional regulator [Lysinibacillus capsici]MDP1431510.1 XRE family transcriptional regulator [Lysinibacillus capsici]WGF36868.1 XRE family transcriptional regulator [Lysinibacillus capsici]